ncbi:MAG: VOC family protein [bacterium]|nr:VOC family protein [bacterium]
MKSIADFYIGADDLVRRFNEFAERHALGAISRADHICYKCVSNGEFEALRALFEEESVYIYQSIISARRIAVIGLKRPVKTALGPISTLELSDQKPDGSQKSGFDHIEIYPTGISYEELASRIKKGGVEMKKVVRPHHTTIDIEIGDGYLVRLEGEPLIDKIKKEEMK